MFTRARSPIVYKTLGEARLVGNIFSVRKDAKHTAIGFCGFAAFFSFSLHPIVWRLYYNVIL